MYLKTRKKEKYKTKFCLKQCEFCVYLDNSFDKSGLWSIGGLIGQGGPGGPGGPGGQGGQGGQVCRGGQGGQGGQQ